MPLASALNDFFRFTVEPEIALLFLYDVVLTGDESYARLGGINIAAPVAGPKHGPSSSMQGDSHETVMELDDETERASE